MRELEESNTPLHYAAMHDRMDALNLLIENGANPDMKNTSGNNCYEMMILNDHVDMLEAVYP